MGTISWKVDYNYKMNIYELKYNINNTKRTPKVTVSINI
jgi:hypothetical protein